MKKTILSLGIAALATGCGGGEGESQPNAQVKPTPAPVQQALETGNALLVSDPSDFIRESRQVVEAHKMQSNTIKSAIAKNLSGLYWDPTHDAAILAPQYGFNDTILMTNKAMASGYKDQALSIGVAGEKSNGQRYALLGSNPFRTAQRFPDSSNAAMTQWLSNLVTWLSGGVTSNVVIAQMDQSYYFPDEQATRNWLKDNVSQELAFNEANLCDGSKLLSCLQTNTPNLLILSQHLQSGDTNKPVLEALEYAEQAQIPVLYLHWDGGLTDLGQDILEKFHVDYVGDNYWRKLGLVDWEPSSLMNVVPDSVITQQALLSRFESQNFNVDLSKCDDKSCPDTANMDSQFYAGANSIRHWLQKLDEQKVDLFNQNGYQYEKLMVLLADHYRQTVVFPMDKQSTQTTEFLKSYFADYVQYNSRSVNPKQPNMGNFSRSEFSPEIKRISATINMESKRNFRSAGVYALPGETFTVKRNDSNDVATKIVINTLRSGATHEFSKDGYTRPKLLTSFGYEVKPGETITLTSPYGGPVQVHFDKNDVPVELKFNHVAQHPVWRSEKDNDAFIQQLEANLFDWAELITPGFEVHSKRDKMLESVNDEMWSTLRKWRLQQKNMFTTTRMCWQVSKGRA